MDWFVILVIATPAYATLRTEALSTWTPTTRIRCVPEQVWAHVRLLTDEPDDCDAAPNAIAIN